MTELYRSKLAYPSGIRPGFDPRHIAARGISAENGFVAIPLNGNYINLASGRIGAIAGTPPFNMRAIGPSVNFGSHNIFDQITFTGNSTVTPVGKTLAAIIQFDSVAGNGNQTLVGADSGSVHGLLAINTSSVVVLAEGSNTTSTITVAANTPYFIAGSVNSANVYNFVVMNLATGSLMTSSLGGNVIGAVNGTYLVGNNGGSCAFGSLGPVMYTPYALPMPNLVKWAQDPWSLWYPDNRTFLVDATPPPPTGHHGTMLTGVG